MTALQLAPMRGEQNRWADCVFGVSLDLACFLGAGGYQYSAFGLQEPMVSLQLDRRQASYVRAFPRVLAPREFACNVAKHCGGDG